MRPGSFLRCGLFMLLHFLCSQNATSSAPFNLVSPPWQPQRRMWAQPLGAVLPLTGMRELSLMVIKDLCLVTGCLLSPPLLQPSGDIIHVDLGGFSVLNSQNIATSAAQCTLKCATQDEQRCHPRVPHTGEHSRVSGERGAKRPEPQALRLGDGIAGLPQYASYLPALLQSVRIKIC